LEDSTLWVLDFALSQQERERERERAVSGATVCAFLGERDREEVIW
jgi:hypothetical protein